MSITNGIGDLASEGKDYPSGRKRFFRFFPTSLPFGCSGNSRDFSTFRAEAKPTFPRFHFLFTGQNRKYCLAFLSLAEHRLQMRKNTLASPTSSPSPTQFPSSPRFLARFFSRSVSRISRSIEVASLASRCSAFVRNAESAKNKSFASAANGHSEIFRLIESLEIYGDLECATFINRGKKRERATQRNARETFVKIEICASCRRACKMESTIIARATGNSNGALESTLLEPDGR